MSLLEFNYRNKCSEPSDINEHLPTLREYGEKCNHITECGVRSVVSSYAFATALKGKNKNKLIQIDISGNGKIHNFKKECENEGVNVIFYEMSDLTCPLEQTDLLFIDTWHVYGHLKRELNRWHSYVNKYIILHDTTVDEWFGETIRNGWNAEQQSLLYGIPVEEINKGLWPAVEEFIQNNKEWVIEKRYINNNGLTILKRV
jgi:hypothetical protein